jgi:hypothetical protein
MSRSGIAITVTYADTVLRDPQVCRGGDPQYTLVADGKPVHWTTCDLCGYQPDCNDPSTAEMFVAAPHPKARR